MNNNDPLLGCRLKLMQAWLHLQSLDADVGRFLSSNDLDPPPHLGVIVGDFLHDLRCVLDHLVWQLVLLNGRKPNDRNHFPITNTPDGFAKAAISSLRGVASEHRELIETFQPYHVGGGKPTEHSLAVLRNLSNIDKHRFVHSVAVAGESDARQVRFTELGVSSEALGQLNIYMTYSVFERFAKLFPLPLHTVDNVIAGAVHDAIATGIDVSGRRPENALVSAIAEALATRQGASVAREVRYRKLPGWTRPPGGVDLVLDLVATGRVLIEMKVDKPAEVLWDALKLGDILSTEDLAAAYLVYAGTERTWQGGVEGAELFLNGGMQRARDLIERWPRAWAGLLEGGRGIRPRRGVGAITVTPICWINMSDEAGRSVQVARVAPVVGASPQEYDDDGWPIDFMPPHDLRAHVRRALAGQQAHQQAAQALQTDPCHGYLWYPRWTDRRLARVVCELGDDAFACLRSRLATERGWRDAELRARVDPLRGSQPEKRA